MFSSISEQAASTAGDIAVGPVTDAELVDAVLELMQIFASIKGRVTAVRDGDQSPVHVLMKLIAGGPARSGELAARMCADPSTVSRQVAALVRDGLVERRADPGDGRASVLVPTGAGLARFADHRALRSQAMSPAVADWSDAERATFVDLLHRFVTGLTANREQIIATLAAADPRYHRITDSNDITHSTESTENEENRS